MKPPSTILIATMATSLVLSGCAFVQRNLPYTMSDANLIDVLITIDENEVAAAELAQQRARHHTFKRLPTVC